MRGTFQNSALFDPEKAWPRFQRTLGFVGTRTFGSTRDVHVAAARVRRLRGYDPDTDTQFRLDEPDGLLWVHCAEIDPMSTWPGAVAGLRGPSDHRPPGNADLACAQLTTQLLPEMPAPPHIRRARQLVRIKACVATCVDRPPQLSPLRGPAHRTPAPPRGPSPRPRCALRIPPPDLSSEVAGVLARHKSPGRDRR